MRKIKARKKSVKQKNNGGVVNMGMVLNGTTDVNIRKMHTKLSLAVLGVSLVVVGVAICL